MYFGRGFYGLAALWTLVVIEVSELIGFVFNFSGLDALFGDGLIAFLFNLAMNQLSNLINAFVWFSYWDGSMLIWVLVAYAGYLAGIEAARRNLQVSIVTSIISSTPNSLESDSSFAFTCAGVPTARFSWFERIRASSLAA